MDQSDETIKILSKMPGGRELLKWFGERPNFGDAEVVSLNLDCSGASVLRVLAMKHDPKWALNKIIVSFHLSNMIDVSLEGFGHQNVIGSLYLRCATGKATDPSLRGIGLIVPEFEITLEPCAGAFGTIRASITHISIEKV